MALNYSHRPIFPAHLSEDNLVSPMRIANGYLVEGIPERSGDGFVGPWSFNRDAEGCFDCGQDRVDRGGSSESVSKDIIDLLPSDPFGMDMSGMDMSTTFTAALSGWLEDLEVDYGGYGWKNSGNIGEYGLFAGLNLIWNRAVHCKAFPSNPQSAGKSYSPESAPQIGAAQHKQRDASLCVNTFEPVVPSVQDAQNLSNEATSSGALQAQEHMEVAETCCDGSIHAAIPFSLSFLGVRDLLSVENVCKSLQSTVRSDPLLWRTIIIDQPLNDKITDELLLNLTTRAQGNLQCLSLMECPKITDDGLKRVLESNIKLTKLCVPGCTRLSIEGIVSNLKEFKSRGAQGIKHLRIGGRYGVTDELFDELKLLLGVDVTSDNSHHQPHYYHRGSILDDDRAIDIEICPRCQKLRLVYDCPAKTCQQKGESAAYPCRACKLCIPRCVQCGHCINDNEYEETFCLEWLCSDCSNRPDGKDGFLAHEVTEESSNDTLISG